MYCESKSSSTAVTTWFLWVSETDTDTEGTAQHEATVRKQGSVWRVWDQISPEWVRAQLKTQNDSKRTMRQEMSRNPQSDCRETKYKYSGTSTQVLQSESIIMCRDCPLLVGPGYCSWTVTVWSGGSFRKTEYSVWLLQRVIVSFFVFVLWDSDTAVVPVLLILLIFLFFFFIIVSQCISTGELFTSCWSDFASLQRFFPCFPQFKLNSAAEWPGSSGREAEADLPTQTQWFNQDRRTSQVSPVVGWR